MNALIITKVANGWIVRPHEQHPYISSETSTYVYKSIADIGSDLQMLLQPALTMGFPQSPAPQEEQI